MRHGLISLGVLLLLAVPAVAGEPSVAPKAPASAHALFFRLEVGVKPGRIVTGWLDERKGTGTGYDVAVVDLDGDGVPETVEECPDMKLAGTGKTRPAPRITVPDGGTTWVVDLRYSGLSSRKAPTRTYFQWSVTSGKLYAWFINGHISFYPSAAAAKAAPPTRIGPPFHFELSAATRGAKSLVRVALKDGNGCSMRLARRNDKVIRPNVKLLLGGEEAASATASYG